MTSTEPAGPDADEEPEPGPGDALFENDFARGVIPLRRLAPDHVAIESRGEWKGLEDFVFRASNEALAGFFRALVQAAQSMGLSESGYRLLLEDGGPDRPQRLVVDLLPGRGEHLTAAPPRAEGGGEGLAEQDIPLEMRTLVLPPQSAVTDERVAALSAGLGIPLGVAKTTISSPLPRALLRRPKQELIPIERRLRESGLAVRVVATRLLVAPFRPFLVERVERGEGESLRVHGPEGEATIAFDKNALLVVGRYSWMAEGRGSSRSGWSSTKLQTMRNTRFAHLWFARSERPFSFVESALTGYEFLGGSKQASVLANFQALIELLDDKPRVVGCYALADNALLVKSVADTFVSGLQRPATTSPDPASDLLSRLYFHLTLGDPEGAALELATGRSAPATVPPPDTLETWLGLGEHYARLGDQDAARSAFEAALRKEPDNPAALVALARTRKDPRQALRDLSRAHHVAPGDVAALCARGEVLLGLGDSQAALSDFNRAIELHPEHPDGWRGLGAVYLSRGDREAAITAFTAAIQAEPRDARSWLRRGLLRLEQEEHALGLADIVEAMKLEPGNIA